MTSLRLNKYISSVVKLGSRNDADFWISSGKVSVNGRKAVLGAKVNPGDLIFIRDTVQGHRTFKVKSDPVLAFKSAFPRIFLYNKTKGQICDDTKTNNIFTTMYDSGVRSKLLALAPLDAMSSGLVVLTDSSELLRLTEKEKWQQTLHIRCASRGPPDGVALKWLKSGPKLGKIKLPSIFSTVLQANYDERDDGYISEISISFRGKGMDDITEGFQHVGLKVISAKRREFGGFELDRLPTKATLELNKQQIEAALDRSNLSINWRLGLGLESPVKIPEKGILSDQATVQESEN